MMFSWGMMLQAGVCFILFIGAGFIALRTLWHAMSEQLVAFAWFWVLTSLLWGFFALRYFLIALHFRGSTTFTVFLISQTTIFFVGPVLYYFLGLRVAANHKLARVLAIQCLIVASIATILVYLPDGTTVLPQTAFGAEIAISNGALGLFIVEVIGILGALIVDLIRRWPHRFANKIARYELSYSVALLMYIGLASVDQTSFVTGIGLVGLRLLYMVPFAYAYWGIQAQHQYIHMAKIAVAVA